MLLTPLFNIIICRGEIDLCLAIYGGGVTGNSTGGGLLDLHLYISAWSVAFPRNPDAVNSCKPYLGPDQINFEALMQYFQCIKTWPDQKPAAVLISRLPLVRSSCVAHYINTDFC